MATEQGRMGEQEQLLRTIEGLYASVLDDACWPEALRRVADFSGGHAAFHLASDPQECDLLSCISVGVDPDVEKLLLGSMADKEIRMPPALRFEAGTVLVDRGLIDWQVFKRSEIYNEVCVPFDVPHLMAVWLQKAPNRYVSLSLEASVRHGPFTTQEIDRFRKIVPYLMRTHQTRELMKEARLAEQINYQVLESLPFGVVMLSASGVVLEMTSTARQMMTDGPLAYRSGRLHALHPEDDRSFRGLIAAALRWRETAATPDPIALRQPCGSKRIIAVAIPLTRSNRTFVLRHPACALLLIDPGRKIGARSQVLQQCLGLSAAEARLAMRLFTGESLADAARELQLSYNTCKSQLKSIYDKTDCSSQTALIKKLMMLTFAQSRP